ncbi:MULTISPECIES: tRNA (cytidine-2'-O-)-methyltransferase TrmJ [Acidianus]|uniref:RNA methyltransferase n=1 Tax=Candidatus Acidianus copahuensis TaxID=1160895 RepID=A0A031LMI1_9CREN|nr:MULTISPECIES: tRNA (cytidine-2'-O-)-methyltransferase TrmJ [Acidianus]EZQ03886.1 RNA methyltransferase [Candidatus Acidianus copahuensis]NON63004.1 RNA methyltransferase [Acidianus sp. RZ1]
MIRVVLVEPEGEYNVGFIARLCKNYEIDELYIVNPRCDVKKAIPFSAKGSDILDKAVIVSSYIEAIQDIDLKIATSSIANNEGDMLRKSIKPWEIDIDDNKKIAIIFGRESVGLTRQEIYAADFLVFIPASEKYPTLNLSHAVSIILYEIWKKRKETKNQNIVAVSPEPLRFIGEYSEKIFRQISRSNSDYPMFVAVKRSLLQGVRDNEEAWAIVRFLRKVYMKLLHQNE